MKHILLAAMLLGMGISSANAAEIPITAGKDQRVTTVRYNENEVYEINAKPSIVTHIVFQKGEEYEAHAFGDGDAWHFSNYKNNIFLKPAQPNGTTNLSVITNKREYMFRVKFNSEAVPNDLYQVRFVYPDEEVKQNEGKNIEQKMTDATYKKIYSLQYSMQGDTSIAPVNVYDDGTFTYFKFPGNVDLPAIYGVIPGKKSTGDEVLINRSVTGEGNSIIVMHKVHPWWRLRLGNQVLDIRNDGMNWVGVLNTSGTIAPDVERVDKETE